MSIDPECERDGICHSDATNGSTTGNCVYCGAEMFFDGENWYHHSQRIIHIDNRGIRHKPWFYHARQEVLQ